MRIRAVTGDTAQEIEPAGLGAALAAEHGLVWLDIDHTDTGGMALLPRLFDVRGADVEDCYLRTPVPKLHVYPDHHYTAINGLVRGTDGRLYFQPLKIFQNPRLVVTVLGPTSSALPPHEARRELVAVHRRLDGPGFRPQTSLDLITAIRREMMTSIEGLISTAAAAIGEFERRVLHANPVQSERMLDELFALRHDLQTIRTSAAQAHQTYSNLLDVLAGEDGILRVDTRRVTELRQGFGHLVLTTDLEREYLQEMLDLYQTRVATELNRFVRRVTAWGAIGILWTVVAGVYGMNFVHIPGLDWPLGFPLVVVLTTAASIALGVFFHRHGWL